MDRWLILISMMGISFLLGMFVDPFAIIFILAPICFPIVKNLGFDPGEIKKNLDPTQMMKPRDDDTYSPLHVDENSDAPTKTAPDEDKKSAE